MTEETAAKMPDDMSIEELHEHYSEMLATANDLGFKVPDELLVETEDADKLREVCAKLDDGITAFRAGLDIGDEKSGDGMPPKERMPKPRKPIAKKLAAKKPDSKEKTESTTSKTPKTETSKTPKTETSKTPKTETSKTPKTETTKAPKPEKAPAAGRKKPVAKGDESVVKGESTEKAAKSEGKKSRAPKESKSNEESTMAKTAKKAAEKAPAKKAAKKAAPKKAGAAKAKKSSYGEKAKITVLIKENPCKKGSPRAKRVDNIMSHHNKSVTSFVESGGKEASLRYSVDHGWIKIVG